MKHLGRSFVSICVLASLVSCQTVTRDDSARHLPDAEPHSYLDSQLEKFVDLADEYPKDPEYHYEIAAIHFQKANYRESASSLRKAIDLRGESPSPRYHYHLGRVLMSMREMEGAEEQFQKAVDNTRKERFSGPRAALAYVLALKGDVANAIDHFERCQKIDPENLEFYYFLGALHDIKEEDAEAIRFFREYLDRGGFQYKKKAIFYLDRLGVEVQEIDTNRLVDRPNGPKASQARGESALPPGIGGGGFDQR
ncbi:MAG: tetratricopeptide repeat protein [Planctomycetota bacterium]